jgi:NAD(P)-dependent dehydrogenase (short-subunit alcohol dehydrogenase family)
LSAQPVLDVFSLAGRVALVTGGARGIGLASVRLLAQSGAAVVVASEDAAACQQAASELRAQGLMASGLPQSCFARRRLRDRPQPDRERRYHHRRRQLTVRRKNRKIP